MPFGLKNVGAIYRHLINKIFKDQIRWNMEVYVDDMLIKIKSSLTHFDDLKEAFTTLQKYKIKLNSTKCTFGVASGKFLGFMVSQRGIKTNLEKVCKPWRRQKMFRDWQAEWQPWIGSSPSQQTSASPFLKRYEKHSSGWMSVRRPSTNWSST